MKDTPKYYAVQEGVPGWLFVFAYCGRQAKCIGPTQDLPSDCLDFRDCITIKDDVGKTRKLYRVCVPLKIKEAPAKAEQATNTQQVHKIAASPHQLPSLRAGVIGRINGNVPAPERELAAYKICLLY